MLGFEFRGGGFALRTGEPGDLAEGRGEAERVARELDRRGIGEILTLARDRGLDDLAEKDAPGADEQHHDAGEDHGQRDRRGILTPHGTGQAEEDITQLSQRGQAGDGPDDAQVELHVSVTDVAELVGDDALELVTGQITERAARDAYRGVLR